MSQAESPPQTQLFRIGGLRAGDAPAIERAVAGLAGVRTLELRRNLLRVETDHGPEAVVEALADCGYRADPCDVATGSCEGFTAGRLVVLLAAAVLAWLAAAQNWLPKGAAELSLLYAAMLALLAVAARPLLQIRRHVGHPAGELAAAVALAATGLAWLAGLVAASDPASRDASLLYLPPAVLALGGLGLRLGQGVQLTASEASWRRHTLARLLALAGLLLLLVMIAALGRDGSAETAIVAAATVAAVLSPFALSLAGPLAYRQARLEAADNGILWVDDSVPRRLDLLDTVFLRRTGVVSRAEPQVVAVEPLSGVRIPELFACAASLEAAVPHPVAEALRQAGQERAMGVRDCQAVWQRGEGVVGLLGERSAVVGRRSLLQRYGVDTQALEARAAEMTADGSVPVYVAVGGKLQGLLEVADPVRPECDEAVRRLRRLGLRVVLLSGAEPETAEAVAARIQADRGADVNDPAALDRLQEDWAAEHTAVVWNAAAPGARLPNALSVRLGAGDAEVPADLVLRRANLKALAEAVELARVARRAARRGRFTAMAYHLAVLPWAAGLLEPVLGLAPRPAVALLLSAVALSAALINSRRARRPLRAEESEVALA